MSPEGWCEEVDPYLGLRCQRGAGHGVCHCHAKDGGSWYLEWNSNPAKPVTDR